MTSRIMAIRFILVALVFCLSITLIAEDATVPLIQEKDSTGQITTTTVTAQPASKSLADDLFVFSEPSPFDGIHPAALQRLRENLSMELRELSRVINQIDPRDQRYLEELRAQQSTMLAQIKDIDAKLKEPGMDIMNREGMDNPFTQGTDPRNMRGMRGFDPMMQGPPSDPRRMSNTPRQFGSPDVPGFGPNSDTGFNPPFPEAGFPPQSRSVGSELLNSKEQQILDLAERLRAMGLNDEAEKVLAQLKNSNIPASSTSPFSSEPVPTDQWGGDFAPPRPGEFAGGMPMPRMGQTSFSPETRPQIGQVQGMQPGMPGIGGHNPGAAPRSPWEMPPSKEITELKTQVSALQSQVEQMQQQMKAVEMQLQLLNQNILLKFKTTE